jgi:hypothetical protein
MSVLPVNIAEAIAAEQPRLNPDVNNKILILDCERINGITLQHFWDRGDLKKRYIHYETTIREPRTTIVCAKWYGEPDIIRLAEWDAGGRPRFLKRLHELVSSADILVGHNIDNADVPWIEGDLTLPRIGHPHRPDLPRLPSIGPTGVIKTVDTLKALKTLKAGMPFKGLDAALQILGHPGKTDHYDPHAMERAVVEKSVEDRENLVDYCCGDVVGTEWLYDWARHRIKNHPALFVDGQTSLTTCNRCGHETEPIPRRYIANILSYSMRRCGNCGAHSRISIEPERLSIVRGL